MDGSCHTPLSFLPVLISIFTVTPDLRPTSEKVRSASKTMCPDSPTGVQPGQGHHLQLAFLLPLPISTCILGFFPGFHIR